MSLDITQQAKIVESLQPQLTGTLILPHSADYDQARRVWNNLVQKYPAAIVRCSNEQDVIATVNFAREHNIPLSVRGGGHDYAGRALCEDGLVIDFTTMKGVEVDPVNRTARAQAGALIEDLIAATRAHGLLTPTGSLSVVGIAGLTLGGGYGPLLGKYGLVLDNLIAADIVTANGQLLTGSATQHPDLFWGLRGGGGNFGVVTTFTYQLHPLQTVTTGTIMYPLEQGKEALRFYNHLATHSPDELSITAMLVRTPDGLPAFMLVPCYAGPMHEAEHALAPLRTFGTPLFAAFQEVEYAQHITIFNGMSQDGMRYHYKGQSFETLSDEAIDILLEATQNFSAPGSALVFHHFHGAATHVPVEATAFAHRENHLMLELVAAWLPQDGVPDSYHIEWINHLSHSLEPYALPGIYSNMLDESETLRYPNAYGANYQRLIALKTLYDPTNLFRSNVNIPPASHTD